MLRALLRNKLGRWLPNGEADDDDTPSVRDAMRTSEDALTATVFERLLFLPPDKASRVMDDIIEGEARLFGPSYPEVHFWPGHALDGGRVEPDVVLVHADRVVVVEVKWGTLHSREQWRRELLAASEHYPDGRELHLVLVGRDHDRTSVSAALTRFRAEMAPGRRIATGWLSWDRVFQHLGGKFEGFTPWERAVLVDLRDALSHRGLRVRLPMDSLAGGAGETSAATLFASWPLRRECPGPTERVRALHPLVDTPTGSTSTPSDLLAAWRL